MSDTDLQSLVSSLSQASVFDQGESARTETGVITFYRENYRRSCLELLFRLCSSEYTRVAQLSEPILTERCASVLQNYIKDKSLQGRYPLSRLRKEELKLILNLSCTLKLTAKSDELTEGERAHLFRLYPLLCKCLQFEDHEVILLLQKCFIEIGESF